MISSHPSAELPGNHTQSKTRIEATEVSPSRGASGFQYTTHSDDVMTAHAPAVQRSESLQTLEAFLREDHPELTEIGMDQDLIDSRILDSLRFMNFLFLLEELTGVPFEIDRIAVDDFRTLRTIEQRFLMGESHDAR